MSSETSELNINRVKDAWIKCISTIFDDNGVHVNDVIFKRLEHVSAKLTKNSTYHIGIFQDLILKLQSVLEEYSTLVGLEIFILVEFQEFLYRFKYEILPYFLVSDQCVAKISNSLENSFYDNMNINYVAIIKQIIYKLVTCTLDDIKVNVKLYTTTVFKTLNYNGIKYINSGIILSDSLDSAIKQILKESEGRIDFVEFIMTFQTVVNLIIVNFDIKERKFPSLLHICFGFNSEGALKKLLELLNDKKLKTATLESINRFCKTAKISDDRFVTLLLEHRPIEYTNDDWNGLLNRIDLVDTFEENPSRKMRTDQKNGNVQSYDDNDLDNDTLNTFINGNEMVHKDHTFKNFSTISKAVDKYKCTLRTKFRDSVEDIRGFHKGLSEVVDSYLDTVNKNNRSTSDDGIFDQTMYALLMVILNYTPDIKLFIGEYYAPRLLKRLLFSQSNISNNAINTNDFENILISILPKEPQDILASFIQKFAASMQNPVHIDDINCEFSGIFLQGSKYSFSLPMFEPIFPNTKFKDIWCANILDVEKTQLDMKFDKTMQIVEMTSPFLGTSGEEVKLILPMSAASILYCFNESNIQNITDFKLKLNITKNQETQLVRNMKLLMKYGLISKRGPLFTLRTAAIPLEWLDENHVVRLL
ncbi:hypothetical protein C6P45_005215 [Maudiozyma exigua]|uniref:Uncharacterized protein n=1 Tax=Maudiozyma exigua TaxID=34358 RepID=A0A9P6W938_MAUEX|nr:hypothetical protein C6P45_005215 [Kazachstania exigua]